MHADDVETVIKRLTQPPMNIPANILSLMNCIIVVKQVSSMGFGAAERKTSMRKFTKISELDNMGQAKEIFTYNLSTDSFANTLEKSFLFEKIAKASDVPVSVVMQEFERRKTILLKMVEQNLRDFRSVHKSLNSSLNIDELSKVASEVQ
jgi:flagellar protein FlaI